MKPNFFIVGAAKSGTSSLYRYIAQHPEIYVSAVKEPHFFCYQEKLEYSKGPDDDRRMKSAVGTLEAYEALFARGSDCVARGEASTTYLDSNCAAQRIKAFAPLAKIVVVLRNPVDRAYAAYTHLRRDGSECHADFATALEAEEDRTRAKWGPLWHYKGRQFTYAKLARYFDVFPRAQLRVYLYEQWQADNSALLKDLFAFLEVDPAFCADVSQRDNLGGVPRYDALHQQMTRETLLKRLLRPMFPLQLRRQLRQRVIAMNLERPGLSPEIRAKLTLVFREDVLRVQDLIGKDLSCWF